MRVRAVGADALLLEVDDPAAWFAELRRRRDAGELTATEIVPGAPHRPARRPGRPGRDRRDGPRLDPRRAGPRPSRPGARSR